MAKNYSAPAPKAPPAAPVVTITPPPVVETTPPVVEKVEGELQSGASDLLSKVDGELKKLEGDAVTDIDNVEVDLDTGFGLLPRLAASLRAAQVEGRVDAEKVLSELHDKIGSLRAKIDAAADHVGDELKEFLASLKSHL